MPARATGFNYYYLIAICLMATLWVQCALARSRYGRAMRATAESENAAGTLGINVTGIRTLAFAISAGLAGLGGGLFANLALFVNFESFTFSESIELLLSAQTAHAADRRCRDSQRRSLRAQGPVTNSQFRPRRRDLDPDPGSARRSRRPTALSAQSGSTFDGSSDPSAA